MARFTIWLDGNILGTYPGDDETQALDAVWQEKGCADFKDACAKKRINRDRHKVQKVEE